MSSRRLRHDTANSTGGIAELVSEPENAVRVYLDYECYLLCPHAEAALP